MVKNLPDKWIRKAVFNTVNNMAVFDEVTGETIEIPCFDTRVPTNNTVAHYILMTTQSNAVDKDNKCGWFWNSVITLEVLTSYFSVGNPGSRLLADNILDELRGLTHFIELDSSSGLEVITSTQDFPNDLSTITPTESVYRKFIRIELRIN